MGMSLAREGAAGLTGVLSEVALSVQAASADIGVIPNYPFKYDAAFEVAALLAASAVQYFSPMTAQNVVDGVADGAIALLGKRATRFAMSKKSTEAPRSMVGAYQANGAAYAASRSGGGHVGGGSGGYLGGRGASVSMTNLATNNVRLG